MSGRWLVLRSALSWAVGENLVRVNPLVGMKGPPRPDPRRHHTLEEVRRILHAAEHAAEVAGDELAADPGSPRWRRLLFSAEQVLLLVWLAADSGARRGELAVLRRGDLEGRVLTIERGLSQGVLGSTKSSRTAVSPSAPPPPAWSRDSSSRGSSAGRHRSPTGCPPRTPCGRRF